MCPNELRDQSAHIVAGAFAVTPAAMFGPGIATLAWATFCMGMAREVTEEGPPVTARKVWAAMHSWRDLLGWTAGGALVGGLMQ